jgi:pSer/pThr/pTyr-binding forkhead associated (FHA) protein
MDLSSDTLYQIVRVLFALSLLGFLYLVIRVTMRELQEPSALIPRAKSPQPRAELVTVPGEEGSSVPDGMTFDIQGVTTIGRAQNARVLLDDTSISAQHALLRTVDGVWTIEDLGSRNGTLVNGRLISSAIELNCGDSLQFGRVRLRLMC